MSAAVRLSSATCISFLLEQKSHKLHIWLNILLCFLTESCTLLRFCHSCQQSTTFPIFCWHPANWSVTQLGKIAVTVQLTWNVYRLNSEQKPDERRLRDWTSKIRDASATRPLTLTDNHSAAAFATSWDSFREGETLHWYLNLQKCDHKNKALDLWQ